MQLNSFLVFLQLIKSNLSEMASTKAAICVLLCMYNHRSSAFHSLLLFDFTHVCHCNIFMVMYGKTAAGLFYLTASFKNMSQLYCTGGFSLCPALRK